MTSGPTDFTQGPWEVHFNQEEMVNVDSGETYKITVQDPSEKIHDSMHYFIDQIAGTNFYKCEFHNDGKIYLYSKADDPNPTVYSPTKRALYNPKHTAIFSIYKETIAPASTPLKAKWLPFSGASGTLYKISEIMSTATGYLQNVFEKSVQEPLVDLWEIKIKGKSPLIKEHGLILKQLSHVDPTTDAKQFTSLFSKIQQIISQMRDKGHHHDADKLQQITEETLHLSNLHPIYRLFRQESSYTPTLSEASEDYLVGISENLKRQLDKIENLTEGKPASQILDQIEVNTLLLLSSLRYSYMDLNDYAILDDILTSVHPLIFMNQSLKRELDQGKEASVVSKIPNVIKEYNSFTQTMRQFLHSLEVNIEMRGIKSHDKISGLDDLSKTSINLKGLVLQLNEKIKEAKGNNELLYEVCKVDYPNLVDKISAKLTLWYSYILRYLNLPSYNLSACLDNTHFVWTQPDGSLTNEAKAALILLEESMEDLMAYADEVELIRQNETVSLLSDFVLQNYPQRLKKDLNAIEKEMKTISETIEDESISDQMKAKFVLNQMTEKIAVLQSGFKNKYSYYDKNRLNLFFKNLNLFSNTITLLQNEWNMGEYGSICSKLPSIFEEFKSVIQELDPFLKKLEKRVEEKKLKPITIREQVMQFSDHTLKKIPSDFSLSVTSLKKKRAQYMLSLKDESTSIEEKENLYDEFITSYESLIGRITNSLTDEDKFHSYQFKYCDIPLRTENLVVLGDTPAEIQINAQNLIISLSEETLDNLAIFVESLDSAKKEYLEKMRACLDQIKEEYPILLSELSTLEADQVTSHHLKLQQFASRAQEYSFELAMEIRKGAAETLQTAPTHPLYHIDEAIREQTMASANPEWGAHFSHLDGGVLKGGNLRGEVRNIEGNEQLCFDFKISHPARKELQETFGWIQNNQEAFTASLPVELCDGIKIDGSEFIFKGKNKEGVYSDAAGGGLGVYANVIELKGLGKVYIPITDTQSTVYNFIHLELESGLPEGETVKKINQIFTLLGCGPILLEQDEAAPMRMKILQLTRAFYPPLASKFDRTKECYECSPEELMEKIEREQPAMKAHFQRYLKDEPSLMKEEEIYPGKMIWTVTDLGDQVRAAGGWGLMAGMGQSGDFKDKCGYVVKRLKEGTLSSLDRFQSGWFRRGASSQSDVKVGGGDQAFVRLVTNALNTAYIYLFPFSGQIQVLYDLDSVNRVSYGYDTDRFGKKDDVYLKARPSLIQLAKTLTSDESKNEVMIKNRIPPEFIVGVVVATEENKTTLIQVLRDVDLVTDEGFVKNISMEIPIDEFVHVADPNKQSFTKKMWRRS